VVDASELHAMHDYRPETVTAGEETGKNMFGDEFRNYENSARQAIVVRAPFTLCWSATSHHYPQSQLSHVSSFVVCG